MNDDLVARWAAGDEEAAEQLYRACFDKVRRAVRTLGYSAADSEDVAQDSLLVGLRELKAGKRPDHLTRWFKGIARHVAARKTRVATTDREPEDETGPSAQSVVVRREMRELLGRTLEGLSASDRELLDLEHRSGLSRKEIAERLELPLSNVQARIGRAMDRVRGALAEHFTTVAKRRRPPLALSAVRALRPIFRDAVEAVHLEGRPEADAARRLGVSEAVLQARLASSYELLGGGKPDFSLARRQASESSAGNGSNRL